MNPRHDRPVFAGAGAGARVPYGGHRETFRRLCVLTMLAALCLFAFKKNSPDCPLTGRKRFYFKSQLNMLDFKTMNVNYTVCYSLDKTLALS